MNNNQMQKIEDAVRKVGGRFKLTVLLEKRVRELVKGAPKLVDTDAINPIDIALDEILAGKIEITESKPDETKET